MDVKTYALMTSADVTIDHIFSLLAPGVSRYSVNLYIGEVHVAKREIDILCHTNEHGKCVHGFSNDDARFILAVSDKPVTYFWMTEEPYDDDDDDIIVPRAHIVITL